MVRIVTIRGATTIRENTEEEIINETKKLLEKIISENKLKKNNVVSIIFSSTKDITKAYPARAARNLGFTDIGLMCFQEMFVEDSLKLCIRVMIFYNSESSREKYRHIYLNQAKNLRPDLIN